MNISDHTRHLRCFDIGGSKIVAADVSPEGHINEVGRIETPVSDFGELCQALSSLCPGDSGPVSISIAGVIHPDSGLVKSANVPCVSGRALSGELSVYLHRAVYLINDANAFALAEAGFGLAKENEIVLAIILGTGIGGGIVVNGQILTGADGTAGEWGHGAASAIRTGVELPKLACNCGQIGCVDTLGGARGLERLYHYICSITAAVDAPDTVDSHSIVQAWLNQEPLAMHVVDVWLDVVGGALAATVNLLGTSVVAVGGGLVNCKPLIDALDKEVRTRCLANFPKPILYGAANGPEQGLLGAAIHANGMSR